MKLATTAELEKKRAFVQLFDGTIAGTTERMRKAGFPVTPRKAKQYYNDPAVRLAIRHRADRLGAIATKEELQKFWTRVVDGVESEPQLIDVIDTVQEIDPDTGQTVERRAKAQKVVHVPVGIQARLKASELLGKSLMAFVERVEVSADLSLAALVGGQVEKQAQTVEQHQAEAHQLASDDDADLLDSEEVQCSAKLLLENAGELFAEEGVGVIHRPDDDAGGSKKSEGPQPPPENFSEKLNEKNEKNAPLPKVHTETKESEAFDSETDDIFK
jgi:hypothetical protein